MPAEVVTMMDCASNYGVYQVEGSKGQTYTVSFFGSEGQPHCTCKSFEFAPEGRKECKHIRQVWDEACMYNPQWHDATPEPKMVPGHFTYDAFVEDEKCECGGKLVYVKRAV